MDCADTKCAADESVWGFFPPPGTRAGFPVEATSTADGFDAGLFPSPGTTAGFPGRTTDAVDRFGADSFPPPGTRAGFAGGTTCVVAKSSPEFSPSRETVVPETSVGFASAGLALFNCAEEGLAPIGAAVKPGPCTGCGTTDSVPARVSDSESPRGASPEDDAARDDEDETDSWMAAGLASSSRACIASSEDPAAACDSTSAPAAAMGRIVVDFC